MSTDAANARPPRKRAKHTRSKLGCGVCRIRRVRCDRTRPACERCTKTGRQCDGYAVKESNDTAPLVPREASTSPPLSASAGSLALSRDLLLSEQGCRALDYFRNKTAPELCGFFESDLWGTLILQISRREPCVRQMVVALSSLHESFHTAHTESNYPSSTLTLRQRAIGEYGVGIGLLNKHITTQGWANLEITLLCSILCVTFEWLRGDYSAAQTHLRSSLLVMSQWAEGKQPLINGTSVSSPGGYMIRTQLGPLWTSLVLQARTMIQDLPCHMPLPAEETSEPFTSLQQARKALDILLAYVVPDSVSRKLERSLRYSKSLNLERRLAEWLQNFDAFLLTQDVEEQESPRVTIMKLWHHTAHMIFIASFSDDEIYFDSFVDDFTNIVNKAGELLSSTATTQFSVDIGTVPLLYYVALKCRHPLVRRRAVSILTAAPRREAVWDSIGAALVVEEVIRVEEEGLGQVFTQFDIPGSSRVCNMDIVTDVEHRRIWMKTLKQGSCDWSEEKALTW
ncbi:Zn(2)-C6 fungal-type domain-containing protein [Fusarium sp. LHS14.1]|nr:Zn(2)-C6 fungal-type domain-containing protein [Fusarium sp. LHS14.1]